MAEADPVRGPVVPGKRGPLLAAAGVPQPQLGVRAGGRKDCALGVPVYSLHPVRMNEVSNDASSLPVPNAYYG